MSFYMCIEWGFMKRISLRVEDEVHQALATVAKEDRRSMHEQIIVAIQEHLRKRSKRLQRAQPAPSSETVNQIDERVRDLPYCAARLGQPCDIAEIGERLLARLKLNDGIAPNNGGGDWQAIAHARHQDTNYEDLLNELPGCWLCDEDGLPCKAHELAYGLLKLEARRLVEPGSSYGRKL
jgi:hypothetical protein